MRLIKKTFLKIVRFFQTIFIRDIYRNIQQIDVKNNLWEIFSIYLRFKWIFDKIVDEYVIVSIRVLFNQKKFYSNGYFLILTMNFLIQTSFRLKKRNNKLINNIIAISFAQIRYSQQIVEITSFVNDFFQIQSQFISKNNSKEFETFFDNVIIAIS